MWRTVQSQGSRRVRIPEAAQSLEQRTYATSRTFVEVIVTIQVTHHECLLHGAPLKSPSGVESEMPVQKTGKRGKWWGATDVLIKSGSCDGKLFLETVSERGFDPCRVVSRSASNFPASLVNPRPSLPENIHQGNILQESYCLAWSHP